MHEQRYVVRCYGGPLAGQLRAVIGNRFSVIWTSHSRWWGLRDGGAVASPRREALWYDVQRYAHGRGFPFGKRELPVAVLDGYNLNDSERREVEWELERQPWKLYEAEILKDFDQWFAWQWYIQTGEITWKAERVWE